MFNFAAARHLFFFSLNRLAQFARNFKTVDKLKHFKHNIYKRT